jgi:hypothetical protein
MSVNPNPSPQPVRALDANGDWTSGAGRLNYLYGTNAIQQNIVRRLYSVLGDCFYSVQDGVNYFFFMGSKDLTGLQLALAATILNTPGVSRLNVIQVTLNRNTRLLTIQYNVNVVSAPLPVQSSVTVNATTYLLTESGSVITDESGSGLILE